MSRKEARLVELSIATTDTLFEMFAFKRTFTSGTYCWTRASKKNLLFPKPKHERWRSSSGDTKGTFQSNFNTAESNSFQWDRSESLIFGGTAFAASWIFMIYPVLKLQSAKRAIDRDLEEGEEVGTVLELHRQEALKYLEKALGKRLEHKLGEKFEHLLWEFKTAIQLYFKDRDELMQTIVTSFNEAFKGILTEGKIDMVELNRFFNAELQRYKDTHEQEFEVQRQRGMRIQEKWIEIKKEAESQMTTGFVMSWIFSASAISMVTATIGSVCGTQVWMKFLNRPRFVEQARVGKYLRCGFKVGFVGVIATNACTSLVNAVVDTFTAPPSIQHTDYVLVGLSSLLGSLAMTISTLPFGMAAATLVTRRRFPLKSTNNS